MNDLSLNAWEIERVRWKSSFDSWNGICLVVFVVGSQCKLRAESENLFVGRQSKCCAESENLFVGRQCRFYATSEERKRRVCV